MKASPHAAKPSVGRSIAYAFQRFVLGRRHLWTRAEPFGLRLRVCAADAAGRHLYKRHSYEPELTRFFLEHVRVPDGGVALDVGANLGWYSLLLAKQFPRARVFAFEPEPRNWRLLTENLATNGCSHVRAEQLALAEQAGDVELYLYPAKNLGRHSLLKINDGESIRIRSVALDDYLIGAGVAFSAVAFLKLDIEGYEYHAFRGAPQTLRAVPMIVSEFSPKYMRQAGLEPKLYVELLQDAGFTPHRLRDAQPEPVAAAELLAGERQTDLVWLKGESRPATTPSS